MKYFILISMFILMTCFQNCSSYEEEKSLASVDHGQWQTQNALTSNDGYYLVQSILEKNVRVPESKQWVDGGNYWRRFIEYSDNTVFEREIALKAGDIVRVSGQFEVSEKDEQLNRLRSYIFVTPPNSTSKNRISIVHEQYVTRSDNHHMSVHLEGSYIASGAGTHRFGVTTKKDYSSKVILEDGNSASDYGAMTMMVWRKSSSLQGNETLRGLAQVVEASKLSEPKVVTNPCWRGEGCPEETAFDIQTLNLNVNSGEVIELDGQMTSTYMSTKEAVSDLFNFTLSANNRRFLATENISSDLYRFSQTISGLYFPSVSENLRLTSKAVTYENYRVEKAATSLRAYHYVAATSSDYQLMGGFSEFGNRKVSFYNSEPEKITVQKGLSAQSGDLLRYTLQLNPQSLDIKTSANCSSRITIVNNAGVNQHVSPSAERILSARYLKGSIVVKGYFVAEATDTYWVKGLIRCPSSEEKIVDLQPWQQFLNVERFSAVRQQ